MDLRWLIVTGLSWALLPCDNIKIGGNTYDLSRFDHTIMATDQIDTPPSVTNSTIYINPCGPVGIKECPNDAQICGIERVILDKKTLVTKIIPYASEELGSNYTVFPMMPGSQGFEIEYQGAMWGKEEVGISIVFSCSQEMFIQFRGVLDHHAFLEISAPEVCIDSEAPKPPKKESGGGWGFFSWLFFLLFIGAAVYAFQFWRANYAHDFGGARIDFDSVADLIRDVPYLVRDFFRKLADTFAGSGRSGYSAI